MKKMTAILVTLVLALTALCAFAETAATDPLHEHMAKLKEVPYTLSTTEFGPLEPKGDNPDLYVELLGAMTFTKTDRKEGPDGEYVVLTFPEENIRFDFFITTGETNTFRLVKADGTEEYYTATVPEGRAPLTDVMSSWYYALADMQGLMAPIEAKMPPEGWVLDSVKGQTWQDDRASLEVFLEDEASYKVRILWSSSASEATEWVYGGTLNEKDMTIQALYVTCDDLTYDEQGNEKRVNRYEKETEAVISLNAEGKVVITNAGDESLEGKTFERVPMEEKTDAEEKADGGEKADG